MSVSALAPPANEIVIQSAADQGTDNRQQPSCPFLHKLSAGFGSDALNNARNKPVHHVFLQQLAAEIHACGAGGSDPQFRHLFVSVVLEAVKQAELLDRTQ